MTKVQARAFIEKHKRRRYDPKLVDLFLALPEPIDTSGLGQNLSILQLQEGMVLTRDLTHDGMLLLAKGAVISARMISTLAKLERAIGSPISVQIETIK